MNVRDRVVNQKLGLPMIGEVICVMPAFVYVTEYPNGRFDLWDEYYPDWQLRFVVGVVLDYPMRLMTFQEASVYYYDISLYDYYTTVPIVKLLNFPDRDLILLDEVLECP